jgi:hypothetical protein
MQSVSTAQTRARLPRFLSRVHVAKVLLQTETGLYMTGTARNMNHMMVRRLTPGNPPSAAHHDEEACACSRDDAVAHRAVSFEWRGFSGTPTSDWVRLTVC